MESPAVPRGVAPAQSLVAELYGPGRCPGDQGHCRALSDWRAHAAKALEIAPPGAQSGNTPRVQHRLSCRPVTVFSKVQSCPRWTPSRIPATIRYCKTPVEVVSDHHTDREALVGAVFAYIRREVEATATILLEYLQEADLEPSLPLPTAMVCRIKTDTQGLSMGAGAADVEQPLGKKTGQVYSLGQCDVRQYVRFTGDNFRLTSLSNCATMFLRVGGAGLASVSKTAACSWLNWKRRPSLAPVRPPESR
jgi:hypothetical protein